MLGYLTPHTPARTHRAGRSRLASACTAATTLPWPAQHHDAFEPRSAPVPRSCANTPQTARRSQHAHDMRQPPAPACMPAGRARPPSHRGSDPPRDCVHAPDYNRGHSPRRLTQKKPLTPPPSPPLTIPPSGPSGTAAILPPPVALSGCVRIKVETKKIFPNRHGHPALHTPARTRRAGQPG